MTQLTSLPKVNKLSILQSPIGKKILTGLSGLGLVLFVIIHLLGNLLLFVSPEAFNQYAYGLEKLKPLVLSIELILIILISIHASLGIRLYLNKLKARPDKYDSYKSAGEPSHQSLSSKTMIFSGLTLGGFLVWHLMTFKFGTWYLTDNPSVPMRDLARLVIETFQNPIYAVSYIAIMVLLGFHLRHGIWSALQSLGAMKAELQTLIYGLSTMMAIAIAAGFILLPASILAGWVG